MRNEDMRPTPPEMDFTIDDILDEFGSGGSRREPEPAPEPEPIPEPEPVSEPEPEPEPAPEPEQEPEQEPQPEPEPEPEPVPEPEYRPDDEPPRENPLDRLRRRFRQRQEDPDEPRAVPEEDDEDGVLPERVPLRERLSAAAQWVRDRIPARDLENPDDAPEEPPEPEPTMDDAAREQKWQCARLHRQRLLLTAPTLLAIAVAVIDGLDLLSQGWYDHVWLRCGIPAGLLALCLLLSTRLWHEAGESLGHGRVTAPAAALVCGLAALADSAQCLFLGQCPNLPFAAPAAALLYLCACGQYRAARARYDSFRLAQLGGTPPYVASVTAAGACKQQGRLEGFYRMWQSPDPAARWQPILTPLYLALATVLALVAALSGHQMNRFLWLWSALLSATVPLSLPLSGTLPLSLLCRRLHKSGCAVAGWRGARAITAARRVVVTDEDLFPAGVLSLRGKEKNEPSAALGTVELNGLKVYDQEIGEALAYAEALCRAAGSQLTPLLLQLMDGQVSFRYDAHDLHYYEDGGIDCTVRGATVAMGSAYFMKKRRIALPRDLKMETGVFMTVDGRLAAIFAVKYLPSRNVEWEPDDPGAGHPGRQHHPQSAEAEIPPERPAHLPGGGHPAGPGGPDRPARGDPQRPDLSGRPAAYGGNRHRQPADVSGGALVHRPQLDRRPVRPGAVVLSDHRRRFRRPVAAVHAGLPGSAAAPHPAAVGAGEVLLILVQNARNLRAANSARPF